MKRAIASAFKYVAFKLRLSKVDPRSKTGNGGSGSSGQTGKTTFVSGSSTKSAHSTAAKIESLSVKPQQHAKRGSLPFS